MKILGRYGSTLLAAVCLSLVSCGGGDAAVDAGAGTVPPPAASQPVPGAPATPTPTPTPTPQPSPAPVPTAMTNPAPGSGKFAGANFWNIDWQGQQEYFQTGVDFTTATNPWRTDLVADLSLYRVLRFMDWNDTNASQTLQAHFATRKARTANQNTPVAYEWQIDLCNRADKDCWITLHSQSNADDWRQLAQLVRTTLKPSLRLYVEWSNEVWNDSFPQHAYAEAEGRRLALPGSRPWASYQVYASVRMFEEFSKVFAAEPQRLVRVLSGQAAWSGPCDSHLEALGNGQVNPAGTWPDAYAIAPYLAGNSIQVLRAAVAPTAKWVSDHKACPQRMGVPLISYEGGADSYGAGSACVSLQRDPAMRGVYVDFLTALTTAGLKGPYMQYTHSGECWGVKVRTGDAPDASPKFLGLSDWLKQ